MILVTGARGVVGQPLCQQLEKSGQPFRALSRTQHDDNYLVWDLSAKPNQAQITQLQDCDALIHCAPIWLLPAHIEQLIECGVRRMVVFSSTSVIGKKGSQDLGEQNLVMQLARAEQALQAYSEQGLIDLTVLRPSMIYGFGLDQNISHIARRLRRLPLMPLAGAAAGLRQPVHASDLVTAAVTILNLPATFNKTYALAGAERLSYLAMVERIFAGLDQPARVLHIPIWIYRGLLNLASMLGKFNYSAAMADRMNQDLVYDISAAQNDFGFEPQAFLTQPQRDLPA